MKRVLLRSSSALVAAAMLMQPLASGAAFASDMSRWVNAQPRSAEFGFDEIVRSHFRGPELDPAEMSTAQTISLLRHRVKYVFVIFNENRSFDHYFGTFPGANGLFSDPSEHPSLRSPPTPSNTQVLFNTDGSKTTISPFRMGTSLNAADLSDIDHGHPRMAAKMDLPGGTGTPAMDRFALNEQFKYLSGSPVLYDNAPTPAVAPSAVSLKSKQYGELAMGYVDCDTIPFMWHWANRFTLFDNIFQTVIGPSTPNAIAMISGQSGDTQWVRHPGTANTFTAASNAFSSNGVPVVNDPLPGLPVSGTTEFSGTPSQPDNVIATANTGAATGTPQRSNEFGGSTNVAPNLTYASLPLTLAGRTVRDVTANDTNPAADLVDVPDDLAAIMKRDTPGVAWGWYQNGYDAEPNLPTANGIASTPHASYIGHHNGPQYFGYVTSNPVESANQHGLGDFYDDIADGALPTAGGVFYIRGGYDNIAGLKPDTTNAKGFGTVSAAADAAFVSANFYGDDDHPGYSDSQISEANTARAINAIADSPYWKDSAIIITYDESEGDYDHVAPRILSFDPAGLPLSRGPRIPLLVISPYARTHSVSHEEGDHNSVIGLINSIFGLNPLADLPDEAAARIEGETAAFATAGVTQKYLGPHDGVANPTPGTGFLLSAFDPARLAGIVPPLPASYAKIPAKVVDTLPHYGGKGCSAIGITPVDERLGVRKAPPADFFPRPGETTN